MRLLLIISTALGLACAQGKFNINNLLDYGKLKYAPNDDRPYTGKVFDLYSDGGKKLDGMFQKGKRSGKWMYYFRDGKKKKEIHYMTNSNDSKIVYYNKDGSVCIIY